MEVCADPTVVFSTLPASMGHEDQQPVTEPSYLFCQATSAHGCLSADFLGCIARIFAGGGLPPSPARSAALRKLLAACPAGLTLATVHCSSTNRTGADTEQT